ncbi:protein yellow [Bacillus rossius redtenbacheri]|uniref:protein yellow n=1 Tax=Bacillus rossius redtenbacheri TaxID=93214 RepID=UPI002FDC9E4D
MSSMRSPCGALGVTLVLAALGPLLAREARHSHPVMWIGGSFQWPCASTKALVIKAGSYVPKNVIATRAQILGDEVFVALPRFKRGNPVTLAKLSLAYRGCQASLAPFPCWSLQEEGDCHALQSVVDLFLDAHGVLWVLDTGVVDSLEEPVRRCPPKVVAFSAKTGKLLRVLPLGELACPLSRLQQLVVDYARDGHCYVYVSDAAARAVLVWDVAAGRGFRVLLPPQLLLGCARKDVLALALVRKKCGNNYLYFTYLSGKRLFSVKAECLRRGSVEGRVVDHGSKPGRMVLVGTDGGSAIFFRYEGSSEVYRWDADTRFSKENFALVHRGNQCSLATHAMADRKAGSMRVLESNFPDFIQGTVGCGATQTLSVMQNC